MDAAAICPLCGGPNHCGVAVGKGDCWCFSRPIPEAVLARVPEDQRTQSCVCEGCVEASERVSERQARGD